MFLVVTNKRDLTSDLVVLELRRRGLPYVRFNTEDVSAGSMEFQPALDGGWQIELPGIGFSSKEVTAGYFRRPGLPSIAQYVDQEHASYCAMEWHAALESLYWSLEDRWLNSPSRIALAENKMRQLVVAQEVGFSVPRTILTNSATAAQSFCATGERVIGKPLRQALLQMDGEEKVIFTSRVEVSDRTDARAIEACPIILQHEIPKRFDVRVTVVGTKVFATSIDSQAAEETKVDWRRSARTDLEHRVHSLPDHMVGQCIDLTRRLDLRFGAIDLVFDPDGDYWFLEINPNGQWGWIEMRTGHPIAAAIVSELESMRTRTCA